MPTSTRFRTSVVCCSAALLTLLAGCTPSTPKEPVPATRTDAVVSKPPQIGGQNVVVLSRGRSGNGDKPEFLSATLLPGRGMNTIAISAWIPGRGETQLIADCPAPATSCDPAAQPPFADIAKLLQGDAHGNKSFTLGGPFLIPFANRIRGKAVHDGRDIEIEWHGRKVTLPANWVANTDGTPMAGHEAHAMHGLILDEKSDGVSTQKSADGETFTGTMHAGDFGGHWFSQNDVTVTSSLSGGALDYQVTVKNIGKEPEPMAIGWHPYFALPSGDRSQALLHIPAAATAEVNNYDDVFPTGKVLPVAGSPLDFNAAGGAKLPGKLLDDSFTELKRDTAGNTVVELRDPAAKYGIRITAVGPDFQAIQSYSPPDKKFVAIEPQYNLGDPLGKEWKGRNTGMVTLKPGESTTWHVKLELFVP